MQFLSATFLWAGITILIPLIIHLFNFRRHKTIYFSDVRFLQNLKNITKQRSTLKNILLMTLRMLIIASLVIAFANPVILNEQQTTKARKLAPPVIYIDNSFSMQGGAMSGLNLETAKNKALEIADAFPNGTDFMLITNDFEQRHNRLVKADAIRLFLQDIALSPTVHTIPQVIERAKSNLAILGIDPSAEKKIYIISDFQKNICDFSQCEPDSLLSLNIAAIPTNNISNIAIDTVEFLSPYRMNGSEEEIRVVVHNYGDNPARNVPIKLQINNSIKNSETFDINPHERKQLSLKYTNTASNSIKGSVSIADLPIDYDNTIYFSYPIDSVKNVLIVGAKDNNKYLRALLGRDANFAITETLPSQDLNLNRFHTVIINQIDEIPQSLTSKIQAFAAAGGNFIFIPSFNGNIKSYNHLLSLLDCNTIISRDTIKCKVATINAQSSLLKNAIKKIPDNPDMPYLTRYFNSMTNFHQSEETILETDSYKKVVTSNTYRAGHCNILYTPLDEKSGNLCTHRLIVPIIYNATAMSQNFSQQYYSIIGRDNGITIKIDGEADLSKIFLKPEDNESEFIPRISGPDAYMNYRIFSENCINQQGFCTLTIDGKASGIVAYNYDRRESQLEFADPNDLAQTIQANGIAHVKVMDTYSESFVKDATENAMEKPIWKYFIILAIFFAICEILVGKFV